jgi:molybdenum cofactor cytidylyltransferase
VSVGKTSLRQLTPKVAAIILAAGCSRRMAGQNKLLLPVRGVPIISHVVGAVLASRVEQVIVVVGHEANEILQLLPATRVTSVFNPEYMTGMASSLRYGLQAVARQMSSAMIILGDMPFISSARLNQLIAQFELGPKLDIVVPVNNGRRGNPVLWGRRYFSKMQELEGDVGARDLLLEYAANVSSVEMSDASIFLDVDTPAALVDILDFSEKRDGRPNSTGP